MNELFTTPGEVIHAVQARQVVGVFQPLVSLRTGSIAGFEVLARWNHPEHGLVLPRGFIDTAERHGLIQDLTEQVMRSAMTGAAEIADVPALAVNVSPTQLNRGSLPALISRIAAETSYPLEKLTVEITESALVEDLELARKSAYELKGMGCKLSLDDFGTGYSSLHHLRALPFDELKIDRSFVASMSEERESRKIVAAMVGLGRSLGLSTVGEGIETAEHAQMLSCLECDIGQGWLFGRPMPASAMRQSLLAPPHELLTGMLAGNQDLTRCSLETMPHQRLALLQAIFDGAPNYICVLDKELRYVSLNRRLANLHELPVQAHLGKYLKDVVPGIFKRSEKHLRRALRGEAVQDVELFRPIKDARQKNMKLLASYQPIFDEVGEVTGLLIAMVDATMWKRAKFALGRKKRRRTADHFLAVQAH